MQMIKHGIALGCLSMLLLACANIPGSDFDEPTVEVAGLRPLKGEGMEARFLVSLRIVNPNTSALEIEGVYYELDVEGNRLLSGASNQATTVPAYGEAVLDVEASASMFGSISLVTELMRNPPEDGLAYELKAKVSIANMLGAVRVRHQGKIGMPSAPN